MKKPFALTLFLMFGLFSLSAQFNSTISGRVIFWADKQVLTAATVSLTSENDTLVAGAFTADDGTFTLECDAKRSYIIEVSCQGYDTYKSGLYIGELYCDYNLGSIELTAVVNNTGENPDIPVKYDLIARIDKKTMYPATTLTEAGSTVYAAFQLFDELSFNKEGKLCIDGNDRVIILKNGRQSELTSRAYKYKFKEIQISQIRRIEVMKNPSLDSNPEGPAGIVNIVFYPVDINELDGSLGFVYGVSVLNQARADLPSQLGSNSQMSGYYPDMAISGTTNRLHFNLNGKAALGRSLPGNEFVTRYYDDGRVTISQVPKNRIRTQYGLDGDITYMINDNNSISFSSIYSRDINDDLAQIPYIDQDSYSRYRYVSWGRNERTEYSLYSLAYTHDFDRPGESFSTGIKYSNDWMTEVYSISDSSRLGDKMSGWTEYSGAEHSLGFSLAYKRPWQAGRFELGSGIQQSQLPARYYQRRSKNSGLYNDLGNNSEMEESVFGAFFNLIHEKKRYDIRLGVRPEYTRVLNNIDDKNIYYGDSYYSYFRFYPNAIARLKINPGNIFSFEYSQRVERPGGKEFSVFAGSDNYELVKVGNPYLKAQFTNDYELRYQAEWKSGSIGLSAYLWSIKDMYTRVYTWDESSPDFDVILKTFANIETAIDRGLVLDFSQRLFGFWDISAEGRYYQIRYSDYVGTLRFPTVHEYHIPGAVGNSWDARVSSTFNFSDIFGIHVSGVYMAPRIIPQGKELERSCLNAGLTLKLFNGNAEFRLEGTDLLIQDGLRQEISGEGFNFLYENFYETQMIRAGFKYNF